MVLQYFDLGNLDGTPSMENGVVVIQLERSVYDAVGDAQVRAEIVKSLPAGVAYILELVDV